MTNLSDHEAHEQYDDMLNEVYGDVEIAGMQYETARALKELDPIAYNTGFNDYYDNEEIEIEE